MIMKLNYNFLINPTHATYFNGCLFKITQVWRWETVPKLSSEIIPWLNDMPEMIGMCRKCLAGQLLNRLDWCESFNPMFCIKCRLIRQRIDGRNVPACSVIYGHRLISGPKEFIYLILTPTATKTHLTSNESRKSLPFFPYLVFVSIAESIWKCVSLKVREVVQKSKDIFHDFCH